MEPQFTRPNNSETISYWNWSRFYKMGKNLLVFKINLVQIVEFNTHVNSIFCS